VSRLLVECGEALYGPQWQSALARDLGVADRTVRRWVAGTSEVPAGLYVDLLRLTQERASALDTLAERLKAAG
jgi:DNA-binding transcriptional regulator YdaS (Cro superfamily)